MCKHHNLEIAIAFFYSATILTVGYIAFGFWTTVVFASGFLGGFVLWLFLPSFADFRRIKAPYWLAMAGFIVHRIEEKKMGFFGELAKLTKVPTPDAISVEVVILVFFSVFGWLAVPWVMKLNADLGRYLAFTFFTAMGITELAHFVFPFFTDKPYGYYPGMASVLILAPLGWWGIASLVKVHDPL